MHKGKIAGALVYLLFLFVVVEIALQAFYYVTVGDFLFRRAALPIYQHEPHAGYGNKPNLSFEHQTSEFRANYYTNSTGFRVPRPGVEYPVAKPKNTYRILLLGPSFAYGWGVNYEKSFAALLPEFLGARGFATGQRIELINAGVPAMYAGPQLNWYKHEGARYRPDLVIQFVYGSMAIAADPHQRFTVDKHGYITEQGLSPAQIWRGHFKKFATVFYTWKIWTEVQNRLEPVQAKSVVGAGRAMEEPIAPFNPLGTTELKSIGLYHQLKQAVQQSGSNLSVVYFPLSYSVHPEDETRWRHLGVRNIRGQQNFDAAFERYLNQHQIPVVNITRDLQIAAKKGQRLYYWLDIHWTAEGNAAAAHAVAERLKR